MAKHYPTILIINPFEKEHQQFHRALAPYNLILTTHLEEDALEKLRDKIHVVLLRHDAILSPSSQITPQIKQTLGDALPIIVFTQQGDDQAVLEALRAGVNEYLPIRPFIPSLLMMAINRAIEHTRWQKIYKELSVQSRRKSIMKDDLTDIYNDLFFERRLDEEMKRSQRYHYPLSMILINIEQFKLLNKQYGKTIGDQVLIRIASTLKNNLRNCDVVARIFDDHFALLLPHTDRANAEIVCQRIHQQLDQIPIHVNENNFILTLSTGIVSLNKKIENMQDVIRNFKDATKEQETRQALYLEI